MSRNLDGCTSHVKLSFLCLFKDSNKVSGITASSIYDVIDIAIVERGVGWHDDFFFDLGHTDV